MKTEEMKERIQSRTCELLSIDSLTFALWSIALAVEHSLLRLALAFPTHQTDILIRLLFQFFYNRLNKFLQLFRCLICPFEFECLKSLLIGRQRQQRRQPTRSSRGDGSRHGEREEGAGGETQTRRGEERCRKDWCLSLC